MNDMTDLAAKVEYLQEHLNLLEQDCDDSMEALTQKCCSLDENVAILAKAVLLLIEKMQQGTEEAYFDAVYELMGSSR